MGKKNKPSSSHKKKFEIKFDPEARKEFLGGFKKRKEISDHVCLVGPACSSGCMNTFAACWPGATPTTSPDSDQQHQPPTAREASPSIKLCES